MTGKRRRAPDRIRAALFAAVFLSPVTAANAQSSPLDPSEAAEADSGATPQTAGNFLPNSDFRLSWTNYLEAAVGGDGDEDAQLGGKLDGYATVAGMDIGLWDGFSINAHAEFVYGDTIDTVGSGTLLPVNTALAFPDYGDEDFDLALNFTQRFDRVSLTVGKINMIDNASRTPIVNSDGRQGFQNIAIAAPPTFITPPSIFGALLTVPTAGPIVTFGLWDPHSAVNETLPDNLFGDGVNGMVLATQPVTIGGRRGFQTLMLSFTTERGIDLNDFPYLLLPPESEVVLGEKRGGLLIRYQFQQFIWQDPAAPSRGWGAFGQFSYVDDNPLPGQWSMSLGLAGNPPIGARPRDRFGIAYFRTSLSKVLRNGLQGIVDLGDEQGVEAFYTFAIGRQLFVSADLQVVEPALQASDTATFLGVRAQLLF